MIAILDVRIQHCSGWRKDTPLHFVPCPVSDGRMFAKDLSCATAGKPVPVLVSVLTASGGNHPVFAVMGPLVVRCNAKDSETTQ